jgi:hypothetical protein
MQNSGQGWDYEGVCLGFVDGNRCSQGNASLQQLVSEG